ncbi:MAG: phospholipase D-like domain-containing protein [Pseudomonadota bacterium]
MIDWATVAVTALATGLLTTLALNFVTAERRLGKTPPRWYGSDDPDFRRSTGVLLGPAILSGNDVKPLVNGDQIFPAMLAALAQARKTICFETFIYWSGEIGQAFENAFIEAAARGVTVHILLDWVGTRRMDSHMLERMEAAGVQIRIFHPLSWYHLARMNNRTHRKLLVVDGQIGFTGGVGIAQQWAGNAQDPQHWRDTHFEVSGPVVAQMQAVFLDNWIKTTGEILHGEHYFPELKATGVMDAQMFGSAQGSGSDSMHLLVLLAITAARKTIDIGNAYFIPDRLLKRALLDARKRGVRIRIVLPGPHTDSPLVRYASRSTWDALLSAGVELYEFMPTMFHCKIMIVDGRWTSVGSANFDMRSFRLNYEANLNVFSQPLAEELSVLFAADVERSRKFVRGAWRRRSAGKRAMEWLAARLGSQL